MSIKYVWKKMDFNELSSQLKSFDFVDAQNNVSSSKENSTLYSSESRRLTRSQSVPPEFVSSLPQENSVFPSQTSKRTPKRVLSHEDEIKSIYLNNRIKLIHKNLETIFEDPITRKGNTTFIGKGKQKRSIYLCREFRITPKSKSRIRKTKIKSLGVKNKPFKMTDDEFQKKMLSIDSFINDEDDHQKTTNEKNMILSEENHRITNCCEADFISEDVNFMET